MRARLFGLLISPFLGLAGAVTASAQGLPSPIGTSCAQATPTSLLICTAKVPSFDGTPLDVDLTLPPGDLTPRPLIVMLHGYGNSKIEWEAASAAGSSPVNNDYNTAW